jgi:hypothetical protein
MSANEPRGGRVKDKLSNAYIGMPAAQLERHTS